jgi:putative ABC transport system substrate-binding protein
MTEKIIRFLLITFLLTTAHAAEAQQAAKIPRIGYLSAIPRSNNASRVESFLEGLRKLGYVEGKNLVIEWRFAEGNADRLPSLAAELVHLKVDVIVAAASPPTRAAKEATVTIPIVMAVDDDPVGSGYVASLARPGGNITGLATLSPEIAGKQLELLKETIPTLSRVAVLGTSTVPQYTITVKEIELAAKALGVKALFLDVRNPKDIESVFRTASKERASAVVVLGSPVLRSQQKQVVDLALKYRLPTAYQRPDYIADGGLMTYGVNINDLFHRAATYVDKILKGAKPADLPVEQPMKFELVINLKTAKQIGLTVPPNVLARANRVIR